MKRALVLLVAGFVFAVGLGLSQMTVPDRVIGFLDFFGDWDPTLAFVMAGAIPVYFLVYRRAREHDRPVLGDRFRLPTRSDVDGRLVAGAALFGIGWGLGGFCPGPALTTAVSGAAHVLAFVAAMFVGMMGFKWFDDRSKAEAA